MHVVVVGMMGAGKTTLGQAVAEAMRRPYLDSDVELSADDVSGRAIAARDGVEALHDREASVLLAHLAAPEPSVITAAASVVESEACRAALAERALVCWLDVPVEVLVARLGHGEHRRAMAPEELDELYHRRVDRFAAIADVRLDGARPLADRVAAIVSAAR